LCAQFCTRRCGQGGLTAGKERRKHEQQEDCAAGDPESGVKKGSVDVHRSCRDCDRKRPVPFEVVMRCILPMSGSDAKRFRRYGVCVAFIQEDAGGFPTSVQELLWCMTTVRDKSGFLKPSVL